MSKASKPPPAEIKGGRWQYYREAFRIATAHGANMSEAEQLELYGEILSPRQGKGAYAEED
jgi:hypothetical protein